MTSIRQIGLPSIPSSFVRLDDRVTSADQYANAHDLKTLRENHNILFARRARQPIAHFLSRSPAGSNGTTIYSMRPASRLKGDVILSAPVNVPVGTREIMFSTYARCDSAASHPDVDIYPVIDGPNETMEPTAAYKISLPAATLPTNYTVTFPVPPSVTKTGIGNFYLYMQGALWGADINSGLAMTDITLDSFMCATNITPWSLGCYFSNLAIEARRIVAQTAIGASYRYQLDGKFNVRPIPGTTTVSTKRMTGVRLLSAALYARAVTSFNTFKGSPP